MLVIKPLSLRPNAAPWGAGTGTVTPISALLWVVTPPGHAEGGSGKWGLTLRTSLPPTPCSCGNGRSHSSPQQPRQRPPGRRPYDVSSLFFPSPTAPNHSSESGLLALSLTLEKKLLVTPHGVGCELEVFRTWLPLYGGCFFL